MLILACTELVLGLRLLFINIISVLKSLPLMLQSVEVAFRTRAGRQTVCFLALPPIARTQEKHFYKHASLLVALALPDC